LGLRSLARSRTEAVHIEEHSLARAKHKAEDIQVRSTELQQEAENMLEVEEPQERTVTVQEPEHTTEKPRTPEEKVVEVLLVLHKEPVVDSWLRPSRLQEWPRPRRESCRILRRDQEMHSESHPRCSGPAGRA
jgi:hypothetical protein